MTSQLPWASVPELLSAIGEGDHGAVAYMQAAAQGKRMHPMSAAAVRFREETGYVRPACPEPAYVAKVRAQLAVKDERIRELKALLAGRESQLEEAWEAAHAAWDASANSGPGRQAQSPASVAASRKARLLLTTPMSGAYPLARAAS